MQAALMLRSKSRVARRRKLRKLGGRLELPSNVATKEIAPFPRYPPESWCTRGRAAWLERGRRCSVQEAQPQPACHRRWVKRNRIQDASLGGSSDDEDMLGVLRGPSTFANTFLYVGLGTIALGLVIAFVGTGEKGFKTVELRLIGPSLIGIGFVCCMLRILFCICPSHCLSTNKTSFEKDCNKIDADFTTSLLRGESKRVSIARRTGVQPKYPLANKRNSNKILNEGMEALRQIATTSLFMQNEQRPSLNRVVPIIKEPENIGERIPKKTEFSCTDASQTEKNRMYNDDENKEMNEEKEDTKNVSNTTAIKASNIIETTINTTSESSDVNLIAESTELLEEHNHSVSTVPITEAITICSTSKLSRQRTAMNHKIFQQLEPHFATPLTAKNDVKEQNIQMETSLSIIQPTTIVSELTGPLISDGCLTIVNNTYSTAGLNSHSSTGAVSRTTFAVEATSTRKRPQEMLSGNAIKEPTTYDSPSNVSSTVTPYASSLNNDTDVPNTNTTHGKHKSIFSSVHSNFHPGPIEVAMASEQPVKIESNSKTSQASMPRLSNDRFTFPSPLSSSSDSESERSLALQRVLSGCPKSNNSRHASETTDTRLSPGNKYSPQQHPPGSIFEPELLLSPAKLGQ